MRVEITCEGRTERITRLRDRGEGEIKGADNVEGGKHEGETSKQGSVKTQGLLRKIKGTHAEEENTTSKEEK